MSDDSPTDTAVENGWSSFGNVADREKLTTNGVVHKRSDRAVDRFGDRILLALRE
jgi:hypothetical protein